MSIKAVIRNDPISGLPTWVDVSGTARYWFDVMLAVEKSIQIDPTTLRPSVNFQSPAIQSLPESVRKKLVVKIPHDTTL